MIIFTLFTIIIGVIPLFFSLILKKKYSINFRNIAPFISLLFLSSCYEMIATYFLAIKVSYWFILYNMLAFISIFYFYYIETLKQYRYFSYSTLISFFILLVYLSSNYEVIDFLIVINYLKVFITSFILISTTLWFVKLIKEEKIQNLSDTGAFYFIARFVLYYCGTLFLFLMSNQLYEADSRLFVYYWGINIFLNFVLRTLVLIGLWKLRIK
jgi:hypothetical protein